MSKKNKSYKSRITARIEVQYFLSLIVFIVGFVFVAICAYELTHWFIWQPENPLYIIMKFLKEYILFFIGAPIIIGWALITYYFMGRPLKHLDEVISAAKKLAHPTEELIVLSDEMKSVQDELNLVRQAALQSARLAKEAEVRKNDLVVYLAHDLKTPLTSVIGYLTLLHDEGKISPELQQKYLSISLAKAERLEDLINEFFEITRFNLSEIELIYTEINLSLMLNQLVFEFAPMLSQKNLKCTVNAPQSLAIKCDTDKIQRVFDNLLRNASFYSYENTTIEITAQIIQNSAVVSFVNCGSTISDEKLGRIFEQFYRLDTSRSSSGGGAGLGLAISKQITEKHGGSITAKSENDKIEFTVTLPLS